MDIETNKTEFINLLRNVYVAKQNNLETYAPLLESFDVSNEDLSIREDILKQYSFGDRVFWEIICQSLKYDGVLRSFEDPEIVMHTHFKESPRHIRLSTKLGELRKKLPHNYYPVNLNIKEFSKNEIEKYKGVVSEIEKITTELDRLEAHFMSKYVHLFVVDKEVLFANLANLVNINEEFYIVRKGDTFYYEGSEIKLSFEDQYVQAFAVLHEMIPKGGISTYKKYQSEFKKKYKKTFNSIKKDFNVWAQANLTEKGKGILSKVSKKDLITTYRKKGFRYNNLKK